MKMMEDLFLSVNNFPTRVLKFGGEPEPGGEMVLVIPGNPGLIGVYIKFLYLLQSLINMPVWIVSKFIIM